MTAAGFKSKVTLAVGEREIDARSVLLVMGLGATKDTEITVRAEGDDAAEAVDTLSGMLETVTAIDAAASG